jgi:hypothetical protein
LIESNGVTLRPMTTGDIAQVLYRVNDPSASPFWYGKDRPVTAEGLPGDRNGFLR